MLTGLARFVVLPRAVDRLSACWVQISVRYDAVCLLPGEHLDVPATAHVRRGVAALEPSLPELQLRDELVFATTVYSLSVYAVTWSI
jgi:hypothetical protein